MGQRIDVNHLNIFYGDFLAVEDVNINIEANKVTAFIGPSGCGKSTVLRTLDRMHEIIPGAHCEGEVLLEGKNLYDKDVDPVAVRRDVGMVFQRPNPFPTMSIREDTVRLMMTIMPKNEEDTKRKQVAEITSTSGASDGSEKGRTVRKGVKIGPNDPCPCGKLRPNGLPMKYKDCCGKNQ